ncbi:MAG: hypothetical protein ACR2KV_10125 [Solirubrobacteraceae bacterium]
MSILAAPVNVFAHSVGFLGAVVAIAAGASRLAALAAPRGIERALAAAVIACTAAILEALGLGLAGLGSEPLALAAAAVLSWAAARAWLPAPPEGGVAEQALAYVRGGSPGLRAALGAVAGILVALTAFALQYPLVGLDGMAYHLPEIVSWVDSGRPGSIVSSIPGVPTGSYPLTNEVLLAWGMGLARSFVPVALWSATSLGLLLAGGRLGLRRLGVPRGVAALALSAVVVSPDFAAELNTPMNDGATLAWLVVTAALTLAAVPARPRLFAVAVLAGALAIGTKTTAGPLVVLVLVLGALRMRSWARPALILAALAGLAAGGTWYVRNAIQHGSPFWPLLPGPFGDPVPASLVPADVRFLERPLATLDGRLHDYARIVAGNLVLLAGGISAAALGRTRRVAAAGAVTLLSLLLWTDAPFTGLGRDPAGDLSLAVTRYLLPGVACGALALALAARRRDPGGRLATGTLGAAFAWSLYQSAQFPFPTLPSAPRLAAGALLGAVLAVASGLVLDAGPRLARVGAVVVAAVAVAGALAVAAPGYVGRNAQTDTTFAAPLLRWFTAQPGFRDGSEPIATTAPRIGLLAGDRLRHGVDLIGAHESCAEIRARPGWIVVLDFADFLTKFFPRSPAGACLADQRPLFDSGGFRVYRTRS